MQVCLNCGHPNAPGAPACESCGIDLTGGPSIPPPAILDPSADPASVGAPPTPSAGGHVDDITSRYDEFAGMVERLRIGTVTPHAFIEWLEEARRQMEARRNLFLDAVEASGEDPEDQAQIQEALEGILDFEEAIEEMWAFTLGETDVSALDSALSKMWQANGRINQAMRNNREHRASLEEDWGFM